MLKNLTQHFSRAKENAGPSGDAEPRAARGESAAPEEWIGDRARQRRQPKTPTFLSVPHAVLRHEKLNRTEAIALAAVQYRRRHGMDIDARTLCDWCGWSRWTSQRALRKLQRLDLVQENGDLRSESFPEVGGWVKVMLGELRAHGPVDALALAQLRTWRELGIARVHGLWFEVTAELLAKFLDCSEKTARSVLGRLGSGQTIKVRSVLRKGVKMLCCGLIELKRAVGRAPFVRVRAERERDVDAERRKAEEAAQKAAARREGRPVEVTSADREGGVEWLALLKQGQLNGSPRRA